MDVSDTKHRGNLTAVTLDLYLSIILS
jgi:hypothetical protein